MAYLFLDHGANINHLNNNDDFALKIALLRKDMPTVRHLMSRGADINLVDKRGRNLLHFAINMSSAAADANFEIE